MKKVKWGINKFGKMLFALTVVTFTGGLVVEAVETPIEIKLTSGGLSLGTIPNLSFEGEIGEGVYSLEDNSNLNVQVSDFRGNGAGWQLQVAMSELTYDDNGTPRTLEGAELIFLGSGVPIGTDNYASESPAGVSNVEIVPGGAARPVMTAANNSGMGTWGQEFNDVTLKVPNDSFIGDYTGILTWTFGDAPS